jgi:hypothetical protein
MATVEKRPRREIDAEQQLNFQHLLTGRLAEYETVQRRLLSYTDNDLIDAVLKVFFAIKLAKQIVFKDTNNALDKLIALKQLWVLQQRHASLMIKPYEIDACKLIEKLSRFLFEFSFLC